MKSLCHSTSSSEFRVVEHTYNCVYDYYSSLDTSSVDLNIAETIKEITYIYWYNISFSNDVKEKLGENGNDVQVVSFLLLLMLIE